MADTFKGIITADGKKRQLPYGAVLETPVSDATLSKEGGFADSKAVGDKFAKVDSETASLKEDLDNANDVLNIDEKEGKAQSVAGWQNVTILKKKVRSGETYKVDVVLDSTPVNSTYIYIKANGVLLKNYQVKNLKNVSYERTFDTDAELSVEIGAEDYTGFVTAKIYNTSPNSIKKINNDIVQVQNDLTNQVSLTKRTLYELFEMVRGGILDFEIGTASWRVATKDIIYFPDDVVATISDGFYAMVVTYDGFSPSKLEALGWKTGSTVIQKGFARIQIKRANETVDEVADVEEYSKSVSLEYKKIKDISPDENTLFYALFNGEKYFSHIDVDYYDGLIIPSQSIFDIRRAKRLGFKAIELNSRKTSDGVFYAFHGHQNCFGNAFHAVDNSDISNVNVSTVKSEYIQKNIRYNSKYEKYRTAPTTLEDALIECKINNIVPVVEISDGNVNIVKSIMGENNYIFGIYDKDRTSELKNCVVSGWLAGTADEMIEKANISNQPYICAINVTDSMYKNYGDEDWKKLIKKIHEAGYFVSCSYQTPAVGEKLLSSGIDIMSSKGEINDFSYGNLFDSESGMDFSDFTSDGNALNGMLNLTDGQTVKPTGIDNAVFLGGSSLHIIFSGKIHIQMGIVDNDFESDGKKEIWLSSFYQEAVPTFLITSVGNSTILELSYKASKM